MTLVDPIVPEALRWTTALPKSAASNNWAISPKRSALGASLFSSDPHLEVNRLPCVWYEATLNWKKDSEPWYAMGATMPGTPALVIGRNPKLAWGVTYAYMDCVDSWVEDCRDAKFRRGDDWLPFTIRKETIERKGEPPAELVFYENMHGTLRGDPNTPGYYLSTRWSNAVGVGADSLTGFANLLETTDAEQARSIAGKISNSSWNFLFSDRTGNIAYQMSGNMPIRRDGWSGLYPTPGWDPENDWKGFAALEDLPRDLNPECGFLATANDDLNDLGRLRPINACVAPYRAERIRSVIGASPTFDLAACEKLQTDLYSIQAERLLASVEPQFAGRLESRHERVLRAWDRRYTADSEGAFVFERLYTILLDEVFGRSSASGGVLDFGFGAPVLEHLIERTNCLTEFYEIFDRILLSERSAWFGGRTQAEVFREALDRLRLEPIEPYALHRHFEMKHLILGSRLPRFVGLNRGPFPIAGGRSTVSQMQKYTPQGRSVTFGPSYRFAADLAGDQARSALPGGPSDRPFSKRYDSGVADWLAGVYRTLEGFVRK